MTIQAAVDLTVIIPTHNRAASLHRLLESIRSADGLESMEFELLVVNNNCSDGTAALLSAEQYKEKAFRLTVLEEPKKGKASALNRGLQSAQGRCILVVDDDVVIDRRALKVHLECYEAYSYDGMQGRVLPGVDPTGKRADLRRLREYNIPFIDYGNKICDIHGLTGTNMSFTREVFEKVGYFDVRLGPGAAGFSEDTEYSIRMRKAGFKIGYTPDAVVYHELDPARYGRAYNRMVEYRKGGSRSIYRHDSICFRVIPNLVANSFRWVFYNLLRKRQKAYKTEGRIFKCLGYLMGKLRRR